MVSAMNWKSRVVRTPWRATLIPRRPQTLLGGFECTYAAPLYECDGLCINDQDGDGVCDELEVGGCQISTACNFNAQATDSSPCLFADEDCESCSGEFDGTGTVILSDADGDGVCDDDEVAGCQDPTACNYNAAATDSATCDFFLVLDAPLLRLAILMKQPPKTTVLVCLPMRL